MIKNQNSGLPLHEWPPIQLSNYDSYKPSNLLVSEFMNTDFLTVYPGDLIDMVIQIMKWKDLEHLCVENKAGKLIGVVTKSRILEALSKKKDPEQTMLVQDVMVENPIFIHSDSKLKEAFDIVQKQANNFLPVVKEDELIGVLSKAEFQWITKRLIASLDHQ
jgi:CBS domain-containing protein